MEKRTTSKLFIPIIILSIIVNSFLLLGKQWLQQKGMAQEVLLWANILLFLVSCASFYLYHNALKHQNTQGFLRNVYSGMMLKMFVCIIAVFIYIYIVGKTKVNKPAIFGSMGLYLLCTLLEMKAVLQFSRQHKNGNA